MSRQTWMEVLASQDAAGTLFNTYTTAKSVINPDAVANVPRNFLKPGRILNIRVCGAISNIVTTPGTINFQVKVGSVAAFDTGAIQLNASAHTLIPFWLDIECTCRAQGSGTSANMIGFANITGKMITRTAAQTDDVQGDQALVAPLTSPAVGTGYDSTVANDLDFWAGFSISNAGNGIQVATYRIAALN